MAIVREKKVTGNLVVAGDMQAGADIHTDLIRDAADAANLLALSTNDLILSALSSGAVRLREDSTDVLIASLTGGVQASFANGIASRLRVNATTHTTDSGTGTETIVGVRPTNVFILGVTLRVTTVIAGSGLGSFDLGDGSTADRYGAAIALAADTTVDMSDATINPTEFLTSAGDLVLTADAGQFDSGAVRVAVHYIDLGAPTS